MLDSRVQTPAPLRRDIEQASAVEDGQTVHTLKDPVTGSYMRLREPERWLVAQFDGVRGTESIAEEFNRRFEAELKAEDVVGFADRLDQLLLLETGRSEAEINRLATESRRQRSLINRILYVKVSAFRPGRFLERLTALYRPLHRVAGFGVMILILVVGLWQLAQYSEVFGLSMEGLLTFSSIPALILALFLLVGVHEFAHAVVCRYYGGQVREMGFLLMYFLPCFYCDVSDAWMFPSKRRRLAVTLAGPVFQMLLLSLSVLVWRVTVEASFISHLARVTAIISWLTLLFNFNPLIKLDGYYLLSDWLEIPNLRAKALGYFGSWSRRYLLGWPEEMPETTARQRRIFFWYGLGALTYTILLVGTMYYLAVMFVYRAAGAPGMVLLAGLTLVIIRKPLARMAGGVITYMSLLTRLRERPLRLALYSLLLVGLVIVLFFIPFPHRVSGEITVRPVSEFSLTLTPGGVLESTIRHGGARPEKKSSFLQLTTTEMAVLTVRPVVANDQVVAAGDTIAVVVSNQTTQEIAEQEAELRRLEGQIALLRAPKKKEEIDEANARVVAARADLEQKRRDYDRTVELVGRGLLSKDRQEAAQAALDIAKADYANRKSYLDLLKSPPRPEEETVILREIEKQQARLEFLRQQAAAQKITTPIAGQVSLSARADTVLAIAGTQSLEVLVPVTDFDIDLVKPNQTVRLKVRAFPDRVFDGLVVGVPQRTELTGSGHSYPVPVVVENDTQTLRHGMSGYAKVDVGRITAAGWLFRKLISTLRVEFWSWW